MSRVDLGSITLNACIDGPEDAPWIVLSNSLGANLSMWDAQIDTLTRKFRVLRYDVRGHGQSDAPAGPYTLDQLESDIIAMMDHYGIEQAAYMGLSMGAMCGMGLALSHGDRFTQMILADGRADAPDGFRNMWDDRIAKVQADGLAGIVEGTLNSWLTEDWRNANPGALEQVRQMVLGNDPNGYIGCCRALQGLDYLRQLGGVRTPTLYVGGSQDMGAAPAVMQAMADATPGARYVEIPNAAHVANINAPETFNAILSDFLEI